MRLQLGAKKIDFEFFDAVDGRSGDNAALPNYSDDYCVRTWRRPLTQGEVGCFASHYRLWKRCLELNETIIVLEDDIVIGNDFRESVEIAASLIDRFDFIRLSGITDVRHQSIPLNLPAPWKIVRFQRGPMGTQGYVLSPSGARRLLEHAKRWNLPVDNYIDSFWQHGVLSFGLLPSPISVRFDIPSDISLAGVSPSLQNRRRVWRPKRFVVRKIDDLKRFWFNIRQIWST